MPASRPPAAPPELLEALMAAVADAIYVVDAAGLVEFVNPAALAVLGYDDEAELVGQPSHATIHGHHPDGTPFPESECPLLRPRVTGETVRVEDDWFVRRDGTFVPVAYSSAPVTMDGGRGAVVVFRDTRERRAVEAAARREAAAQARAQELHDSRARIVAAADAERRRLGRDLHDGAQQRLVNVGLAVQLARRDLGLGGTPGAGGAGDQRGTDGGAPDLAAADELLRGAQEEAQAALDDLRELGAGLHPSILTNRGLHGAVESLTARTPIPTRFDVPRERWPAAVESAAYFTIAEALANAGKHAGASSASVEVVPDEAAGVLRIRVRDDGRGGASAVAGHGLEGLRDRVGALGGTLRVDSPPGGGTTLEADLPLAESGS